MENTEKNLNGSKKSCKVKVTKLEFKNISELLKSLTSGELFKLIDEAEGLNKEEEPTGDVLMNRAIAKIADKLGIPENLVPQWLDNISLVSPISAFNIVARELAIELDKKYIDHIENSEKIFVISPYDGVIHEVCKKYIKNYRNFPAFRTTEDAKFVCNLLRPHLKGMFKGAKKAE